MYSSIIDLEQIVGGIQIAPRRQLVGAEDKVRGDNADDREQNYCGGRAWPRRRNLWLGAEGANYGEEYK